MAKITMSHMVTEKCGASYNFVLAPLTFSCYCVDDPFLRSNGFPRPTTKQSKSSSFLPLSDFSHISSSTTDYLPSIINTILKLQGLLLSHISYLGLN